MGIETISSPKLLGNLAFFFFESADEHLSFRGWRNFVCVCGGGDEARDEIDIFLQLLVSGDFI